MYQKPIFLFFFLLYIHKMEQPPVTASEEIKKPRKRFVGRAKKTASDEANTEGGAIEDGAVGFASKSLLCNAVV